MISTLPEDTPFSKENRSKFPNAEKQALEMESSFKEKAEAVDKPHSPLITLTARELLNRDIPPREFILHPWLPEAGLTMVFAPPGVGKTYLCLATAIVISTGGQLFDWEVSKARDVLYVDAEMHEKDLQDRLRKLSGDIPNDRLRFVNGGWQSSNNTVIPDISRKDGQKMIEDQIKDAKVLILDNLSTLSRTGRDNEASSWMSIQEWGIHLRHKGIAVIFVHHAGKTKSEGGDPVQRGTSAREIVLESTLCLKRPKQYSEEDGCVFEVKFPKSRGFYGKNAESFEARLEEKNGRFIWHHKQLKERNYDLIVDLYNDGITNQKAIAEELGISQQAVSKSIVKAKKVGDIQ